MIHLTARDVNRLLPPAAAITAARDTAATVAAGGVHTAERIWHSPADMPGQVGVMPSYLPATGTHQALFVTKLIGVFPAATPSVNGIIAVLDGVTAQPLATIDAAAVTAVRTAAGSGLAIDLLADPDAATIAVLGAGVQAWAHLLAVMAVRPIAAVRVWNRTPGRGEEFAASARELEGIDRARVCATPTEATRPADIVCVCTNAATPILGAADVTPGTVVTAIGAFTPDTRELAADLMAVADHIVVDDRAAAFHEAGDILLAITDGAITPQAVTADLAELVSDQVRIPLTPSAIQVYKSVGTSAMDAVVVRHLLAAARFTA